MAGETLFFIPDISGFTKFRQRDRDRAQPAHHPRLLEALVDANTIGLEVSEFEGDAVLFYRPGAPPPLTEMVEQARRMFVGFQRLLRRFTVRPRLPVRRVRRHAPPGAQVRGACRRLRQHAVKDRIKLIGRDVIVAHRLLKNSVPSASTCC